jgi:hypothetical protein
VNWGSGEDFGGKLGKKLSCPSATTGGVNIVRTREEVIVIRGMESRKLQWTLEKGPTKRLSIATAQSRHLIRC